MSKILEQNMLERDCQQGGDKDVDGDIWTKNNEKTHGKMLHREQILSAKALRWVNVGLL